MAKRARGSTIRPGQRAPLQRGTAAPRPATRPTTMTPPPATLTAGEEARAGALEAQIVAEEKAAEELVRKGRARGRREAGAGVEPAARVSSIALRATEEYGYVARDVRRIVVIGGSMVAILIGLWVAIQATGIGPF